MIAPNAFGGKGFAGGNVAQRLCAILFEYRHRNSRVR